MRKVLILTIGDRLRYRIENRLKKEDYKQILDFLDQKDGSIQLYPGKDFEFVSLSPLLISIKDTEYSIEIEANFRLPLGIDVLEDLSLSSECGKSIIANYKNVRLSKTFTKADAFEEELNKTLKIVERIVNYVCSRFDKEIKETFVIDSEFLDNQFQLLIKKEEFNKRGERPIPFGKIHAANLKAAIERAGNLIPIYIERDKSYLYEDKNVYLLLPREFVIKLLKIDNSTWLPSDLFNEKEKEAINELSAKQYLKVMKSRDKVYYCNLNEKTRKILISVMKKIDVL